jgi:hypothetical protein
VLIAGNYSDASTDREAPPGSVVPIAGEVSYLHVAAKKGLVFAF